MTNILPATGAFQNVALFFIASPFSASIRERGKVVRHFKYPTRVSQFKNHYIQQTN